MSFSSRTDTAADPAEVGEALLNRRLRRVDWRFLLPLPRVDQAVCYPAGDLRDGVALIAEHLVDREAAGAGTCDLAVVTDPDDATLREAWNALRPGGMCYAEWARASLDGPARLRSRLQGAGFERARFYLPWRSPARAAAWIPLESMAGTRYFQRRWHARNPRRQLPARWLRSLFTLGARVGLVRPLCALARKPGEARSSDGLPLYFDMIRREWKSWGLPGEPNALSLMLLTGGPRSGSKVAGLVFSESWPDPPLIVKLARSDQANAGLLRESRALVALDSRCRSGRVQAPTVVFTVDSDGLAAVGETALPGAPLLTMLNRGNYRRFALMATDWLIDLAVTSRRNEPGAASRLVREVMAEFEQNFGAVIDPASREAARRALVALEDLPLVCEHRDFSPWNLFVTPDDRLAVFDWESSVPDGLPFLDLLYFLTYMGSALDQGHGDGVLRTWHATRDPGTPAGAAHHECVVKYTTALGLEAPPIPALSLLLWMIHSGSEFRRLVGDVGGRPSADALGQSLFLQLWDAELHRLRTG